MVLHINLASLTPVQSIKQVSCLSFHKILGQVFTWWIWIIISFLLIYRREKHNAGSNLSWRHIEQSWFCWRSQFALQFLRQVCEHCSSLLTQPCQVDLVRSVRARLQPPATTNMTRIVNMNINSQKYGLDKFAETNDCEEIAYFSMMWRTVSLTWEQWERMISWILLHLSLS